MMLRLGTCGTWTGTDLSSPNGPLLKWEWVKTGHIFLANVAHGHYSRSDSLSSRG